MSLFSAGESRFRALAIAEGVSLILLVGVAVPLKYALGLALATRVVGPIHGILFLLYEVAVFDALGSRRWPVRRVVVSALAAFVPFGSFWAAWRYREDDRGGGKA